MENLKTIREKIRSKKLTEFDLQDLVKHYAFNVEKITIAEELATKDLIYKGADLLKIDRRDMIGVYNSYREEFKRICDAEFELKLKNRGA